jgi:hypothetical protein
LIPKAVIFLALLALGCKAEPPAAPDAPALAKKVVIPVRPSFFDAPRAADAARGADTAGRAATDLAPSPGPVGVAPCDEYLAKMARCIKRLGPEAAEPMKNAMAESTQAWKHNARTPEGRAALVDSCRQALEAARSAAAAMGCDW